MYIYCIHSWGFPLFWYSCIVCISWLFSSSIYCKQINLYKCKIYYFIQNKNDILIFYINNNSLPFVFEQDSVVACRVEQRSRTFLNRINRRKITIDNIVIYCFFFCSFLFNLWFRYLSLLYYYIHLKLLGFVSVLVVHITASYLYP